MRLSAEAEKALFTNQAGESLVQQLEAAQERYQMAPKPVSKVGAAAVAKAAAERAAQAVEQASAAMGNLDPAFRGRLEAAHGRSVRLFGRAGIAVPALPELAAAYHGANYERLQAARGAMDQLGLQPDIVITARLEPEQWETIFESLAADAKVNEDQRIRGNGLYIQSGVLNVWGNMVGQEFPRNIPAGGREWQVAVMPGVRQAPIRSVNYFGHGEDGAYSEQLKEQARQLGFSDTELPAESLHVTASLYLAAQAGRLQEHEPLLDDDGTTSTWLQSSFPDDLQAPYGVWHSGSGKVSVLVGSANSTISHGIRLPVDQRT